MNFDFSEQQKTLQSEARRFLREQCSNDLVRSVMDDSSIAHDQDLWQQVIELGWPAISIDEEYGGLGLGYLELCLLAQELGRSLAPIPYASSVYLFAEALKQCAGSNIAAEYLPKIASGELIGCVATAEEVGKTIEDLPSCTFMDGELNGEKLAVSDGEVAAAAIVSAQNERGAYCLLLVNIDETVQQTNVNSLDPSRPQASLTFNSTPARQLGKAGDGRNNLQAVYNRAAVLFAFEQIGGCEAALKMGMKYTQQRYAFGRPVASFQAIKHKFADMYVAQEIAKANAYYAAWALANDAPELPLAAATARVSAIDAYFLCSKENLQAHGGMGYTWEFDCHLHYRRAQYLSLNIGSAHYWKERVASELLSEDNQHSTLTEAC